MEAVHVLDRGDRADDPVLVDLVGQRKLAEDPGHAVVGIEVTHDLEELVLRRLGRELVVERFDPHLTARLLLALDVDL